jgi:multidrug efflux pump subunit AcrA (membrane-fusion protein)
MTSTPSPSSAAHRARRYAAAGLTGVALLLTSACEKEKAAAPPPPVVEVVTVAQRDVPIYMEWIGSLDGNVNAVIRPQVTGYLIRQNYREGDLVKQGQPLFEIDPRTFEAAVDEAKGLRAQQVAASRRPRPTSPASNRWRP